VLKLAMTQRPFPAAGGTRLAWARGPRACLAAALLLTAVGLLAGTANASAGVSRLRLLVPSVVRFASDGSRYAAWQVHLDGPIVVLNTLTGARHVIPRPTGCNLENGEENNGVARRVAAAGQFLLSCPTGPGGLTGVLRARDGQSFRLPEMSLTGGWTTLGSRYAEGYTREEKCAHTETELKAEETGCIVLLSFASAVLSYRPHGEVVNLDKPGAPLECPAVQKRARAGHANAAEGGFSTGLLAIESSRHNGDVEIVHCHGRATVLSGRGEPKNLRLDGGLLTWDNGLNPTQSGFPRENKTLTSYRLANRSRRSWTLPLVSVRGQEEPTPREPYGYSTHTTNAVFWIAPKTLESVGKATVVVTRASVYSARL
jgi:hypothetical protein